MGLTLAAKPVRISPLCSDKMLERLAAQALSCSVARPASPFAVPLGHLSGSWEQRNTGVCLASRGLCTARVGHPTSLPH